MQQAVCWHVIDSLAKAIEAMKSNGQSMPLDSWPNGIASTGIYLLSAIQSACGVAQRCSHEALDLSRDQGAARHRHQRLRAAGYSQAVLQQRPGALGL